MQKLHIFLNALLIFCSSFVFLSENPVYSVLFLIISFCSSAAIMFLFHAEFLALIFVIVYVGAVAVLFLFVVMMLNVKIAAQLNFLIVPIIILSYLIIFTGIFTFIDSFFFEFDFVICKMQFFFNFNTVDSLTNANVLGQSLYNYFVVCFLICGFILLIAMLGAIILTLNFKSWHKNEVVSRQLSRGSNFLSYIS